METEHIRMQKVRDALQTVPQMVSSSFLKKSTQPFLDLRLVDPSVVGLIERVKQKRDALFEKRW